MAKRGRPYSAPFRVHYTKEETYARKQAADALAKPETPLYVRERAERTLRRTTKEATARMTKRKEEKQQETAVAAAPVPIRKSKRDPAEAEAAAKFLDSLGAA